MCWFKLVQSVICEDIIGGLQSQPLWSSGAAPVSTAQCRKLRWILLIHSTIFGVLAKMRVVIESGGAGT